MPESKKEVLAAEEAARVKEEAARVKKEAAAEKEGAATETKTTKVIVEKKADAVFVSVSPVGSKEYTDELAKWELEHVIKSEEPEA